MIFTALTLLSKASDLMDEGNNPQNLPIFRSKKSNHQIWYNQWRKIWNNVDKYCKYIKKNENEKATKIMLKITEDYNKLFNLENSLPVECNRYVADLIVIKSFIEKGYFYGKSIDYCRKIGLTWYYVSPYDLSEMIYVPFLDINKEVDKLINLTPLQKQVLKLQRQAEYKIEVYKKYLPNHVDEVIKEIEEFEKEVIYNFNEQNPKLKNVMDNLNNVNNNTNQQVTNNVDVQQLIRQNQQLQQQMAQMQQQMNQLLQQQNQTNDLGKIINNMLNREK